LQEVYAILLLAQGNQEEGYVMSRPMFSDQSRAGFVPSMSASAIMHSLIERAYYFA
jgi:hypothetical protein